MTSSSSSWMLLSAMRAAKPTPAPMRLAYEPISEIFPPSITTTWSALGRYCRALVTSTTVLPLSAPVIHCSKRAAPTCVSTADRGSSRRTMSASAYTARAMDTRCFCPPERVTPRSPISVWSPKGSRSRSWLSWATLVAWA
mmetsp:Transcript_58832/g.187800  ORF Transcript_58832/g.187800 Transcript_58832/m.187800 type:complete len:141 (+) Transcript_58832:2071-2493(+)